MGDNSKAICSYHDTDLINVKKEYFFDGISLPCNIFLRISPNKYILIGRTGSKVSLSNLSSFVREESFICVLKVEYPNLLKFVTRIAEKVMGRKEVPSSVKVRFLKGLTEDVINIFNEKQIAQPEQLKKVANMVLDFSQGLNGFSEVSQILSEMRNDDAKYAMSSCLISLLIAEELGITARHVLEKISIGCLLQDIGLKYIPKSILDKPKHEWTPQENEIYEFHPMKSVEMLREMRDISNDILLMIAEHHENAMGAGFPKKIRDVKISPFGRILIVSNAVTQLLFTRVADSRTYSALEAMDYMDEILGAPYNRQVFRAFKTIVGKNLMMLKQAR